MLYLAPSKPCSRRLCFIVQQSTMHWSGSTCSCTCCIYNLCDVSFQELSGGSCNRYDCMTLWLPFLLPVQRMQQLGKLLSLPMRFWSTKTDLVGLASRAEAVSSCHVRVPQHMHGHTKALQWIGSWLLGHGYGVKVNCGFVSDSCTFCIEFTHISPIY